VGGDRHLEADGAPDQQAGDQAEGQPVGEQGRALAAAQSGKTTADTTTPTPVRFASAAAKAWSR